MSDSDQARNEIIKLSELNSRLVAELKFQVQGHVRECECRTCALIKEASEIEN